MDPAPPTRVISVPTTEGISFSSGNISAGDISIESADIHEKNSVNTQAFEAENTSSQWGHPLKKNQNYRYPPRWKKPPKRPIKQGSLSPNWRVRDDTYKLYPDKGSLTSSVLHMSDKVHHCIGHRPPDDGYCNQSSRRKSRGPFRDKCNIKCFNCSPDLVTTNRNVHNAYVLIYLDKHTKRHQGHLMMYLPHAIYNVNAWWIDLNSHLTVLNRIHFMEGCDIHIHIHSNVDYGILLSTIN